MTTQASAERAALCDLFEEVGPDAPTLCGDWTTRDLAAHLVIRERRPDGAIGIVAKPFADYAERVRRDEAARPWQELVDRVRKGPPMWSPMRFDPVDRMANTVEFFVHHEDVRRAQPSWTARSLDPRLVADLRGVMARMGKLLGRKAPSGLTLVATDAAAGPTSVVVRVGDPMVTATGPTGELALFVYGRQAHAMVELDGPADAVAAMRAASLGV
jgi:uncharacterized protein (TIGR03085 family)